LEKDLFLNAGSQASLKENYMRRLLLSTVALTILTSGVWAQAGSQAQTPTTTAPGPAASDKKVPEGKTGKHHHHHKHHHKKQAAQQ
jgi:hypothetical protein